MDSIKVGQVPNYVSSYYKYVTYQNALSDSWKYVPKIDSYRMKPAAIGYQIYYADHPKLFA